MRGGITLRGRDAESAALGRLLGAARSGESAALVVRGEPGIGKTALLDYAIDSAPDLRLLRAVGVQSEIELAFAGLHQLCAPMLGRLDRLPSPQCQALSVAFGLSGGEPPDRFVVSLAALGLLSDAAEEQPLLCAVDDAQWLDEESALALAFVARRLFAESVAIVFVTRERSEVLSGLPELVLDGLDADDARSLLASGLPGLIDEQVRDRIVAETRGNPLALLELPRGLSAVELAGGFGVPDHVPLADGIEQSFLRRLKSLRGETQRLLLAAAAEPVGDVALLWRAAERLGLGAGRGRAGADGRFGRARRQGCGSVIRWCARPPTGRRPCRTAGRCTGRSPRQPIRRRTPTGARGTLRRRRAGPTSRWPLSSSARPIGHELAAVSPPWRHSWNERLS